MTTDTHTANEERPAGVLSWIGAALVVLAALGVLLWTTTWLEPNPKVGRVGGNSGLLLALMVFVPLLGAAWNAVLGSRLSRVMAGAVGCASTGLSFMLALLAFNTMRGLDAGSGAVQPITYTLYKWVAAGTFRIPAELVFDPLSAVVVLVVTGAGLMAHVHGLGRTGPGYARFFAAMNLLCFAMLVMVLGGNMLVTFVGWGLVGASTYLLVGQADGDAEAPRAALKAFLVGRIGDFLLLAGLCLVFFAVGSLDYRQITRMALDARMNAPLMGVGTLATVLLPLGCAAKAAQVPFHVWLPDTAKGPAAALALIQGSVTVVAAVYFIARLGSVFALAPVGLVVLMVIGAVTAVVAALFACAQVDLKKALAYVAASQVGFIFMALGAGAMSAAVFHLVTHGVVMALLLLSAGSVLYATGGQGDITQLGGLRGRLGLTHVAFLVGALALVGVPGLAGFFSRDAVLFGVLVGDYTLMPLGLLRWPMLAMGLLATALTAFAVFRVYFLVFGGEAKDEEAAAEELPAAMMLPMVMLALVAVVVGYVGLPEVLRLGPLEGIGSTFQLWLEQSFRGPRTLYLTYGEMFQDEGARTLWGWVVLGLSFLAMAAGTGGAFVMYAQRKAKPLSEAAFARIVGAPWVSAEEQSDDLKGLALVRYRAWQVVTGEKVPVKTDGLSPPMQGLVYARHLVVVMLGEGILRRALEMASPGEAAADGDEEPETVSAPVRFLRRKGYADLAYNMFFVVPAVLTGRALHWFVDVALIDTVLVSGPGWFVEALSTAGRKLQNGNVQRYAAYMVFGLGAILLLMFFR